MVGIATSWTRGTTSTLRYTEIASSGHMGTYSCQTIDNDPFGACLHSWEYITESCYNSLNDAEKAKARSRHGIVTDTGWAKPYQVDIWTYYTFDPTAIVECFSVACSAMLCADVVCEPMCYTHDLHETYCVDGVCEQGELIEENSYDCDYTDPTVFDMIIDNKELLALCALAGIIAIGASSR